MSSIAPRDSEYVLSACPLNCNTSCLVTPHNREHLHSRGKDMSCGYLRRRFAAGGILVPGVAFCLHCHVLHHGWRSVGEENETMLCFAVGKRSCSKPRVGGGGGGVKDVKNILLEKHWKQCAETWTNEHKTMARPLMVDSAMAQVKRCKLG